MIREIAIYTLLGLGILSAASGVLGLFRFKVVYMRLLVSANVDTVGMLLMMAGALVAAPDATVAFKIVLITVLSLITSPLSTHAIAQSAYASGYRIH